jgi:hypothetical protein
MKMVGTAKNMVTRSRAMDARIRSGTKRRWSTRLVPATKAAFMIAFWPKTWKRGKNSSARSVGRMPMWWAEA